MPHIIRFCVNFLSSHSLFFTFHALFPSKTLSLSLSLNFSILSYSVCMCVYNMQLWPVLYSNNACPKNNCIFSKGKRSPRSEVLINIDPLSRGGESLYNDTFDSSIRGAIRVGPWKLITGIPDFILTFSDGTVERTSEATLDLVKRLVIYVLRSQHVQWYS